MTIRFQKFFPNKHTSDPRYQSAPVRQRLNKLLTKKHSDVTLAFLGDSVAEIGAYSRTCNRLVILEKQDVGKWKALRELGANNIDYMPGYSWPGSRAAEVAHRINRDVKGKIDRLVLDGNSTFDVSIRYITDGLNELQRLNLLADKLVIAISCLGGAGTRGQIVSLLQSHDAWVDGFAQLGYDVVGYEPVATVTGCTQRAVINYEIFELTKI